MNSIFKFWAYLLVLMAFAFTALLVPVLMGEAFSESLPLGILLLFSTYFIFVWIWIVFGEWRTKVIAITITKDCVVIKRFFGLLTKTYKIAEFDGYKTSVLISRSGAYEYLYLIIEGKKVVKLSEFYHKNYKLLKNELAISGLKNLGFENFSYRKEIKESFT